MLKVSTYKYFMEDSFDEGTNFLETIFVKYLDYIFNKGGVMKISWE